MTNEPQEKITGASPLSAEASTPARLYGALGDGKDHFKVDQTNAAALDEILPGMRLIVADNRACLRRMVATAADLGIRQYIDLGSGLPDQPPNLHEVAQRTVKDARFIYVDNDPMVCTHGRALLQGSGVTMIEADARDICALYRTYELLSVIETGRPVCVVLGAILHFFTDDEVKQVMEELHDFLAPGSLVLVTHATSDQPHYRPEQVQAARDFYEKQTGAQLYLRSVQEIADLVLPGCVPLRPGLVTTAAWHPDYEYESAMIPPAPYFTAVAAEVRAQQYYLPGTAQEAEQ
ncbi:SAM-dependent methyltransferase [Nonomuraea sp. NPDC050478]|uniref:SAM-dependent methyltransferase n=1 Tax=Nonomuraea sp. NPDC050478 TaxID=3364365 RepID=UPI00378D2228